ncbi:MAG: hypothetical protein IT447_08750 [Phycisphaerales bacterium]|nr:hypothetical protein [Phycisphaerales bacterium]
MFQAGAIETRLGIDLGPYEAGMRRAAAQASGLANGVAGAMGGFASRVGRLISSPIAQAAAVIGSALTIREVTRQVSEAMDAIDRTAKAADVAGMTTEAYIGLAHAADMAGVESASLEMGLRKLQTNLVDATAGAGEAGDALAKRGLDAGTLLTAGPDAAVGTIADALNRLPSAAERSAAAAKIFGERAGPELLNMLSAGSEGIRMSQEEAAKLGLTMGRVDAAKVEQANDAISNMGKLFTGVMNHVAVALAPYLEGLAKKFIEVGAAGEGIGPKIAGAVEWVAMAVAKAADLVKLLELDWYVMKSTAVGAMAGVLKMIDLVGAGITKLINLVSPTELKWTDTFSVMADSMWADAKAAHESANAALVDLVDGENSKAAKDWYDKIKAASQSAAEATAASAAKMKGAYAWAAESMVKAISKIDDAIKAAKAEAQTAGMSDLQKTMFENAPMAAIDPLKFLELADALGEVEKSKGLATVAEQMRDLQAEIDSFGLSDFDIKIKAFGKIPGVGADQVKTYTDMMERMKGLDAGKKLDDQAKAIAQSVQTPLEKYQEQMDLLGKLLSTGRIDQRQFDLAKKQADEAMGGGSMGPAESRKVAAVDARSAQAWLMRFGNENSNDPTMKVVKEQRQGNQYLARIDEAVRGLKMGDVVEV